MDTFVWRVIAIAVFLAKWLVVLYGVYHVVIAIGGLRKKRNEKDAPAKTRFAIIVPARNEARVIGCLLDSLRAQDYPCFLYDVFVAPNNCTDDTQAVAEAYGAKIFHPQGDITSKGQVLTQAVDSILQTDTYNAICVFDADNMAHPQFLRYTNNMMANGADVVQGYRDSKNATAAGFAAGGAICYWALSRFYNGGRERLGLSSLVSGTGFVMSTDYLRRTGGWHTKTITEDYEFSAQCVLAGARVRYAQDAIFYDEQPATFKQSWAQRRRCGTGYAEGSRHYLRPLLRRAVKDKDVRAMDVGFTFANAIVLSSALLVALYYGGMLFRRMAFGAFFSPLQALLGVLAVYFLVCMLFAAFVTATNMPDGIRRGYRGILFFPIYLLTWLPITCANLLRKQKKWTPIEHTCTMRIEDLQDEPTNLPGFINHNGS